MITKEKYVLNKIKIINQRYEKKNELINPRLLRDLIEQWEFDYEMEKIHRPEILKENS